MRYNIYSSECTNIHIKIILIKNNNNIVNTIIVFIKKYQTKKLPP